LCTWGRRWRQEHFIKRTKRKKAEEGRRKIKKQNGKSKKRLKVPRRGNQQNPKKLEKKNEGQAAN